MAKPAPMSAPTDPWSEALEQLTRFGLAVESLEADGAIHRVPHREDRPGKKNGWYVVHEYRTQSGRQLLVGAYGWWKEGEAVHRLNAHAAGLSYEEQQALAQKRAQAEEAARHGRAALAEEAARRARAIWPNLQREGHSPYLARKQVAAFEVRFAQGSLVVPLRTGPGDEALVGLQWIHPDGSKRFLTGTAKKGAYALLGPLPTPGQWLAIGEGYATVASACMATGWSGAVAFDAGNLGEVARAARRQYPGVRLLLLGDDDHATQGNPGLAKASAAARAVAGVLAVPRFNTEASDRGSDWNDLHVSEGLSTVRAQLLAASAVDPLAAQAQRAPGEEGPGQAPGGATAPGGPPPSHGAEIIVGAFAGVEWPALLQRTDKGLVRPTSYNTRLILEHDPAWKGVLGYCEFSHTIQKRQPPPYAHAARGEWEDGDDAGLRFWLAARYGIEPKGQDLADAVYGAAIAAPYHPVRDYLDALAWDGVPRLYRWLKLYLGAGQEAPGEDEPAGDYPRYLERAGELWLIQAVSRVRRPGYKADAVLILEGAQGAGKSTALRLLFGDQWFSDTPIEIGSKDAYESIRGLWGFEMAELDSLNKADATRAKAFFSSATDRFRMPYGRRAKNYPRQCVIAGTTNHQIHLKDTTGNRRFWSVTTGAIDMEALARDRDQLWAEADYLFQKGSQWWPTDEERYLFEEQQDRRLDADVWESVIQTWLREQTLALPPISRRELMFTAAEIMQTALKIDLGSMKRPEQTRVGQIMAALGWHACRIGRGAERVRGYRPTPLYLASLETRSTTAPQEPPW